MSCCPPSPPSSTIADLMNPDSSTSAKNDSSMRKDEPFECYAARVGNQTGKMDDATENVKNKIDNNTIAIIRGQNISIYEEFKLTAGSDKEVGSWTYEPAISGILFKNGNFLSGGFSESDIGKTFKIMVTAKDLADEIIDQKSFTLAPTREHKGDTLQLISPMPGGIINSKFGPRVHPISKVVKPHTGIDMKMENRSVVDIVSAADGVVIFCGGNPSSGYGLNVKIKHSDTSGKTIAITTYNHLSQIYVKQDQKVMAGQKIGKEGSTGASTGNHLHFEVRTPEGKCVDPVPFFSGPVVVANKTNPDGSPDPSSKEQKAAKNGSLSANETAKRDNCPTPSSANTPQPDGSPLEMPPNPSEQQVFEVAWDICMRTEVGPHWKTGPQFSPGDHELDMGLCDTPTQRKKCGMKGWGSDLGGMTKFGITAASGVNVKIKDMTYAQAKAVGYNNYWKSPKNKAKPESIASKNPYIAIFVFDVLFMSWSCAAQMWDKFSLGTLPQKTRAEQLEICEQLAQYNIEYLENLIKAKPSRGIARSGWLSRISNRLRWVSGVNI